MNKIITYLQAAWARVAAFPAWVESHLVENWRDAWKWLSVQMSTVTLIWMSLPTDQQASVVSFLAALFGINVPVSQLLVMAIIIGRVIDQRKRAT